MAPQSGPRPRQNTSTSRPRTPPPRAPGAPRPPARRGTSAPPAASGRRPRPAGAAGPARRGPAPPGAPASGTPAGRARRRRGSRARWPPAPPSLTAGSTSASCTEPSASPSTPSGNCSRIRVGDVVPPPDDDVGTELAHQLLVGLRRVGDDGQPVGLGQLDDVAAERARRAGDRQRPGPGRSAIRSRASRAVSPFIGRVDGRDGVGARRAPRRPSRRAAPGPRGSRRARRSGRRCP